MSMDGKIWIYKTNPRYAESFEPIFVESELSPNIKDAVSSGAISVEQPIDVQEYGNISLLMPKYNGPNTWTQENKISTGDIFFVHHGDEYRYFAYVLFTAVDENQYFSEEVWPFEFSAKQNLLCLSKPIEISLSQERMRSLFGYQHEDPSENLAEGMAMSPSDSHQKQFHQNCPSLSNLIDEVAVQNLADDLSDGGGGSVSAKSNTSDDLSEIDIDANDTNRTREDISNLDTIQSDSHEELRSLRDQALDDATDSPSKNIQNTSPRESYSRSEKIKQFALERADGTCEGCGKPAPFNRKTGGPYLEVHHVDELGEGGADHPDKVVALCPNCHRRVHYGRDGEEFNHSLIDRLENY